MRDWTGDEHGERKGSMTVSVQDEALDLIGTIEAALGGVSEGVTIQTADGRVQYANAAALRLLGFDSLTEFLAVPVDELERSYVLHGADGVRRNFADLPAGRILAGQDAADLLVRFRRTGAPQDRWATVRASPVRDRAGQLRAVITLFRDVTDAVAVAERLRFQAGLLDELESAVIVTGSDGRVEQWSRGAERLFGVSAGAALGRDVRTLLVGAGGLRPRRLLDALASPRRWTGEVAWRRPDGRFLEMHATASPIRDAMSRPAGTVTVIVDLSERRRVERRLETSERRLRELADLVPQLVWTVLPRGRFGLLNRRWRQYVGEGTDGRSPSWESIIHPDEAGEARRQWRQARRRRTRFTAELRLRRADGVYRWHLVNLEPIPGVDRRAVSWIGTAMDIDERRRADDWLRLIAGASRALEGAAESQQTLTEVGRIAVAGVADWLALDVLGDAAFHLLCVRLVTSEVAGEPQLRAIVVDEGTAGAAAREVARTGRPVLHAGSDEETLDWLAPTEADARVLEQLATRSVMVVPLLATGRGIGALTFGSLDPERPYGESDVGFAEDLARRVSDAIERARLYAEVSDVKATLDATLDSVVMFDPSSLRITYASRGASDQLGYAREQLLGMSKLEVLPEFDEPTLRSLVRTLIRERTPQQLVTLHHRRDGTHLPVELSIQYVVPRGGAGRVLVVARDISERVQAQARLQRLVQAEKARAAEFQAVVRAIGEAVFVCARDGTITFANDAAEALFGEAHVASYAGILDHLEGGAELAGSPQQAARHGALSLAVLGSDRWLELSVFPVGGEEAEPDDDHMAGVAWILLLRDITAARRAERSREALIGVLSHELRTPITTIYGASTLLGRASGHLSERQREGLIADIQAEADRLHRLVEDLLVLARQGEPQVETVGEEPLLLQRVLPTVVRIARRQWPGVRLVRRVPRSLPTVRGDATYVEQIVRNLLSNAIKYSPPGSPVALVADAGDREVRVRVLDHGPGIEPEERERLFEPFFRSPRLSSRASGAGIGLFVCRQLAEAMGGRVWAARRPQGGAEFGFALQIFSEVDV